MFKSKKKHRKNHSQEESLIKSKGGLNEVISQLYFFKNLTRKKGLYSFIKKYIFLIEILKVNLIRNFLFDYMLDNSTRVVPLEITHPIMTQEVIQNYEKVLSYSKLKLHEQISYRNVKILEEDYIHQIYTKCRFNLPHLVFVHGFGGTSITAIRMFQHLQSYFQVHALDIFGFGFSSRGDFSQNFTQDQTREYFIKGIQQWRKALKIDKFYLAGHSFGGYIAMNYAVAYPQKIRQLILISPAGTSQRTDFGPDSQLTCKQKMFFGLAKKVYNLNIRPSKAMSNCLIGNKFVNSILINRLKIPQDEQKDWSEYFNNVNSQDTSSQVGFYKLFQWPLKPKMTIQDILRANQFTFQIDFYFGDSDWMPRQGADRLVKQKFKRISITTVPDAGHQIVFDNSAFLCRSILQKTGCK